MQVTVGNKRRNDTGIYVGRPHALGNPFFMNGESQRDAVCDQYEAWITSKIEAKDKRVCDALNSIYLEAKQRPVRLICWCAPKRCHADTIARLINEKLAR